MWIERRLSETLVKTALSRPVILLTGVRQTGKSSLLKKIFPQAEYVSFDNLQEMDAAREAPGRFLDAFQGQTILDEIQYVPGLFRELKIRVDQDRENYGKWILTGSQQFELAEHISESLAGRVALLHLETLGVRELHKSSISTEHQSDYLWKGGYPEIWSNPQLDINVFFEGYLRTYIERDLKSIIDVKNLSDFRKFFRILAVRIGQLLNYVDIARDVGVSDVTIRHWVHALQVSGLIYLLPPYYANIGKRLVKSPKLYFADHGLAAYLLGIQGQADWDSHLYQGSLWENMVMMELMKNYDLRPGDTLFFYRDQKGVEIDFVIEKGLKLTLIEAKSSETIKAGDLNFSRVVPHLKTTAAPTCLVAHCSRSARSLDRGDWVSFNPLNGMPEKI